jgi:hypothetical protein
MLKHVLLLMLTASLAACSRPGPSFSVPTVYKMILQDGTADPGNLTKNDFRLDIILRPQPDIAGRVVSGSLTLQGKTFRSEMRDGTDKSTQPGDVGPLSLQLCRDVQYGQNIGVELNFFDAAGALLEQGHATIKKLANGYQLC